MIIGEVDEDYFSSRRKEMLLMLEINKEEKFETKGGNMETKVKRCVSSFANQQRLTNYIWDINGDHNEFISSIWSIFLKSFSIIN